MPKQKRKVEDARSEALTLTKDLRALGIKGARDHRGRNIESFTVRETDGDDETIAVQAAAQHKEGGITPGEELVKLALVAVNGDQVDQPYDAYDRWNSKARSLAMTAYRQLNGTSPEEMEAFLKQGEIVDGGEEDSSTREDSPSEGVIEID